METKVRGALKSFIWRIVGVLILGAVTYAYTGNWIQTTWITFLHHGTFLIVFYLHERIHLRYNKIRNLLIKSLVKMFTYETLCGNIILGLITYFITGSVKQMTQITVTYIAIKHIVYIWNEIIWVRISWGQTNA